SLAIGGTDSFAIGGTDGMAIGGTDVLAIGGTDSLAIGGTDSFAIGGTDGMAIGGTDMLAIGGTDSLAIGGTDSFAIGGTDAMAIGGTNSLGLDGSDLLALGRVETIGDGFISVLGQTVFGAGNDFAGINNGSTVAIFGSIDSVTGGFADTRVMRVSTTGFDSGMPSFLRGTVDAVDAASGRAIVSGMAVDYNAMLSNGVAPRVGEQVAVSGRAYSGLGLLVAEPDLRVGGRH
ncbi:MAG: hypothetical protein WBM68_10370, partial [Woeseia sp.]